MSCGGRLNPVGMLVNTFGKLGAKVAAGAAETLKKMGEPLFKIDLRYMSVWNGSTKMPPLARSTVLPFPMATPSRGAKLFLSVLKLFEYWKGDAELADGGRYTSYRNP